MRFETNRPLGVSLMVLTLDFRHQKMPQTNREDAATPPQGESESRLRRGFGLLRSYTINWEQVASKTLPALRLDPPEGQRRERFQMHISHCSSRFGASHGLCEGRWLATKPLDVG